MQGTIPDRRRMTTALADCYIEGMDFARKAEYDRAHKLLAECVVADPANYDYVDGLLLNLARKVRQRGVSAGPDEELRAAIAQAVVKRDWAEVFRTGPKSLSFNPWHAPTLLALAQACAAEGFDEAELRYLQMAYEAGPGDIEINRHCARSLARMKKFDEAINSWQRVCELAPGDEEAARMAASLSIEKSRQRGEKERPPLQCEHDDEPIAKASPSRPQPAAAQPAPTAKTSRSNGRDHETGEIDLSAVTSGQAIPIEFNAAANVPVEFQLTPVQKLEAAIRDYPSNPDYYVDLIPMYLEIGRDYDAERLLAKAKEVTDDYRIRQLWEDVVMLRMSRKIALARQTAAKDNNDEAKGHLAELCRERDRFETEVFISRSLREPKNAAIRYQLGLRLRQAGKIREGIQCFSEALHDPVQKPLAALEMGRSHEELREFPEALQRYRLAAESAALPEQLEARKQALYLAAALARRIKMHQLAKRYLTELVGLDPRYKEAAAWLKEMPR
jgi:tetratricopeptide (TPR) repeat protein